MKILQVVKGFWRFVEDFEKILSKCRKNTVDTFLRTEAPGASEIIKQLDEKLMETWNFFEDLHKV